MLQTQTSWFTKAYEARFTQTPFTSRNKGRHLHPTAEPPSPLGSFPCPFGGSPTGLPGCSWPQGLAWALGPPVPRSWGTELGSAGADGATRTAPVRNLHEEGHGSPGAEGFTLVPRNHRLLTHLLLRWWGTEAAAQLTAGRDWIPFLINTSVAPTQDSLVFIMLFS